MTSSSWKWMIPSWRSESLYTVVLLAFLVAGCSGGSEAVRQAELAYRVGDLQGAIALYEIALNQNPDDDDSRERLATLYLEEGDQFFAKQHFGKARLSYQRAIDTGLPEDLERQGYEKLLDTMRALDVELLELAEVLEVMVERNPEDIELRLELAQIYDDHGMAEQALTHYEVLVELEPSNTRYKLRQAAMLRRLERYEEAIALYEQVLAEFPNTVECLTNLALLYEQTGQIEKAEQMLLTLIELAPDRPGPYFAMARFYERQGRQADAQRMKVKAEALIPRDDREMRDL